MWKSEEIGRANLYKCSGCKEKEDKVLVCFQDGDKDIGIPTFDNQSNMTGFEEKSGVNPEDFIYILSDIQQEMKNPPPLFEVMQLYYKAICPLSMMDQSFDLLLLWETYASEYGIFPNSGGLLDQPNIIVEAFLTILATRNEYEKIREEKVRKDINRSQASSERKVAGTRGLRM